MTPLGALELFAVGVAASIFGSIVGLGGGFVIIPVLRIAFGVPPAQVAGTSLLMVLANTAASTFGYLRARTIDLRLAGPFTLGAVPGSKELDRLKQRRQDLGLPAGNSSFLLLDPATGERIPEASVPLHLRKARVTQASIEANTSICSGMFKARYPTAWTE